MSDEKEKAGQCGWIAFGFFMVFLQGFLPLGITGGLSALKIAEFFPGHPGTTDLLGRLLVLVGIVSGLLLSAVTSMIIAVGFAAGLAWASDRIKILFPRIRVRFKAESIKL